MKWFDSLKGPKFPPGTLMVPIDAETVALVKELSKTTGSAAPDVVKAAVAAYVQENPPTATPHRS